MEDPREILARKIAAQRQREKEADPHGFHDMTERELIDWLGAGNAQPGSQVHEHGKLVLQSKQNQRLLVHGLDSQPEEKPEPEDAPPITITGTHLTIFGLILAVFFGAAAVVSSPITTAAAVVVAVAVLAAVFVRRVREPTLRAIDRAIG